MTETQRRGPLRPLLADLVMRKRKLRDGSRMGEMGFLELGPDEWRFVMAHMVAAATGKDQESEKVHTLRS